MLVEWVRLLLDYVSVAYFFSVHVAFALAGRWRKRAIVPSHVDDELGQLLFISAREAARLIRERQISARQLVEAYVRRLTHVNKLCNAVAQRNYDIAFDEAEALDKRLEALDAASDEWRELAANKPLLGVPLVVRDTIKCAGLRTTCGLAAFAELPPNTVDAVAVSRLREAGAIVIATSRTSEAGLGSECVSATEGRAANPYDERRIAGGDAESALIGAAGALVALGAELGGSMRLSALLCGVFSLRPSPHVAPRAGNVPDTFTGHQKEMFTTGIVCRYAADLSPVFKVFVGAEAATRLGLERPVNLRRLRVFQMRGLRSSLISPLCADHLDALSRAAKWFEKKYDTPVYHVDFPVAHHAPQIYATSARRNTMPVGNCLAGFSSANRVHLVFESVRWFVGYSDHTASALLAQARDEIPDFLRPNADFVESKREQLRRDIRELLADDGVLLFPSVPRVAYFANEPLWSPFDECYTSLWAALGLPVLTAPLGLNARGLPTGVQVVGNVGAERLLIKVAEDLEEAYSGWANPTCDVC